MALQLARHMPQTPQAPQPAPPQTPQPAPPQPPQLQHTPSQAAELERLQLQQYDRYQQQLQQLKGGASSSADAATPPAPAQLKQQEQQEQRRRQWLRLQQLQHEEIERQLQRGSSLNSEPVGETRAEATAAGTAGAEAHGVALGTALGAIVSGGLEADAKPPPSASEALFQPLSPTRPLPLSSISLPGGSWIGGACHGGPPARRASLESGVAGGCGEDVDDDSEMSLKQLAAPLVGLVGKVGKAGVAAASAIKRRGSAAAAAASAAAGEGRGAAAAAAAAAFAQPPGTPPPPPPPSGSGGSTATQRAAAEVESAQRALRVACEPHTATLSQQRQALPASAASDVDAAMAAARARVNALGLQLGAELEQLAASSRAFANAPNGGANDDSTSTLAGSHLNLPCACDVVAAEAAAGVAAGVAAGAAVAGSALLATSAVDACAALGEAREARALEVEATLRACEKRLGALRSTRCDAAASLANTTRDATLPAVGEQGGSSTEVAAADKALRELNSSAAFELEQALWRGGLRGAALQARVQQELDDLRQQWQEHRAAAEQTASDEARRREAQKKSLAAYVHRSMLDAATHSLSRLADVLAAGAGDLAAIALRALHQRTVALQRAHAAAPEGGRGSYVDGDGSEVPATPPAALVLGLVGGAEALLVQLHAELSRLADAVAASAAKVIAWVRTGEDAELRAVAQQANDDACGALGISKRALDAKCAAFDDDLLQARRGALDAFVSGLALSLEFAEAVSVGELLRVAPAYGRASQLPPPSLPPAATAAAPPPRPQLPGSRAPLGMAPPMTAPPPMTVPPASGQPAAASVAASQPRVLPQRAVARPCASVCASMPAASLPPAALPAASLPAAVSSPPGANSAGRSAASGDEERNESPWASGEAEAHAAEALQRSPVGGAAFDADDGEATTPITTPMAPGTTRAFDEAWLNSRGSLFSPASQQTADTRASSLTGPGSCATPIDDTPLGVTPPAHRSAAAEVGATAHAAAEASAAAAVEPLVVRKLSWEEVDVSADASAAAAAEVAEWREASPAATASRAAVEAPVVSEAEALATDAAAAGATPADSSVEDIWTSFLDEAALQVGLEPQPSSSDYM